MSETILIVGATSGIACAVAQRLASEGNHLILAARNEAELQAVASDLAIRYEVTVNTIIWEALDFDCHQQFVDDCWSQSDTDLAGAVICHGLLPNQHEAERDWNLARETLDINFTSAVSLLEKLALLLQARKDGGFLAVVSSVAGDRGRGSNYLYGAAKGGLSIYLQGLRNRLFRHGVHVLTIKPGFVFTAMTAHLLKEKSPLVATPDQVARDICRAIKKRKNVIYTRWFWRCIMRVIRCIPEWLFKRLKL